MLDLETVPRRYEDAVVLLAGWHRDREDANFTAYSFPDPDGLVVRLVEVSNQFPAADAVRPIHFGRSAEFPFLSAVALLSVQDWAKVRSGFLPLPAGWTLESARQIQFDDQI